MLKKIFVVSPLSSKMVEKFVSKYGYQFEQITCGFLKNAGVLSTIKILRSIKDMTVIFEDKESEQLTNIFLLLFIFTKSKKINFIKEDLSTFSSGKRDILHVLIKSTWSLIVGCYCAIKIFFISKLMNSTNNHAISDDINDILYLKANYWFGVKAGGSVAHIDGVIGGFKKLGYNIDYAAIDCPTSIQSSIRNYFPLPIPKFLSHIFSLNLFTFDDLIYKSLKKKNFKKYKFIYNRIIKN